MRAMGLLVLGGLLAAASAGGCSKHGGDKGTVKGGGMAPRAAEGRDEARTMATRAMKATLPEKTAEEKPAAKGERAAEGAAEGEVRLKVTAKKPGSLDLVLVLDTTGSMGGQLRYLQAEMDAIARKVKKRLPNVSQRYGLVAYRDEGQGDEYVTRKFDF